MASGTKSIAEKGPSLRWGVERRLEFVEFRLFWDGYVNRSDLTNFFGVSTQQASTDLNRYRALAPHNMIYDKSAKRFRRSDDFKPLFLAPDPARYLAQLWLVSEGVLTSSETWLSQIPCFDMVPFLKRSINPKYLRNVLDAIRSKMALEIQYQSLSRPKPIWRWISPHALGFDGYRWHVRAFCHIDESYKDFLLPRILGTRGLRPQTINPEQDKDWFEVVTLLIGPNPAFSDDQRRVVELDYGMTEGVLEIRIRRAFLYYALKRLGLDRDLTDVSAAEQHVVLLNREEVLNRTPTIDAREDGRVAKKTTKKKN